MNSGVRLFLCIILCLILALFLSAAAGSSRVGKSSDPDYIFYKGNTLYEEGKYDLAVKEYSRLLEQGLESGNLYYNLGNCYFKTGELGKAILNYERARKIIPRDSDLESNYRYARSLIKGNVEGKSRPWYGRLHDKFDVFTINETCVLLSSLFVLIVLILTVGLFFNSIRKYHRIVLPVLFIIFALAAFSLYSIISLEGSEAVIITEDAEVRFEPLDNATAYFTLYEGMKVYILESKKDWSKVRRGDSKIGWLRNRALEMI